MMKNIFSREHNTIAILVSNIDRSMSGTHTHTQTSHHVMSKISHQVAICVHLLTLKSESFSTEFQFGATDFFFAHKFRVILTSPLSLLLGFTLTFWDDFTSCSSS